MNASTIENTAMKTRLMRASHALVTLVSVLLMALAFSHPARSESLIDAVATGRQGQDQTLDARSATLGHVIVPAKEVLRKAHAAKPQPKGWPPGGKSGLPALCGASPACLSLSQNVTPFPAADTLPSPLFRDRANPVRAPPALLFIH